MFPRIVEGGAVHGLVRSSRGTQRLNIVRNSLRDGSPGSPQNTCPLRLLHTDLQRTPAFHDLLQFHLQGLDGSRRIITSRTLDPVNREFPISHCGDVVVLKEDDPVGMFYDSTGARKTWASQEGTVPNSCKMAVTH